VHGLAEAPPGGVLQMTPVAERYRREYFEQPHDIFLGEQVEEDGSFTATKVCCLKRTPRKGFYDVLYRGGAYLRNRLRNNPLLGRGGSARGRLPTAKESHGFWPCALREKN
jgi:hypothetical protein